MSHSSGVFIPPNHAEPNEILEQSAPISITMKKDKDGKVWECLEYEKKVVCRPRPNETLG